MKTDAFHLNLDRLTRPQDVLDLTFLARQVSDRPHVATTNLRPSAVPMEILPADCRLIASFQISGSAQVLAESSDCTIHFESYGGFTHINVAATSHQRALEVVRSMEEAARQARREPSTEVVVWHHKTNGGGDRSTRPTAALRWPEIGCNYPRKVRAQLGTLVSRSAPEAGEGRLILFHGEPGTGKTTAIQALMDEWSEWCQPHLVTDPDRMFADSQYLMTVLESEVGQFAPSIDRPAADPKWKLIVAEDADAFLRSTARSDAGAALGRLLNTTDGLLGQSSRSIVLLTTNEELPRLHPALIRPGRSHTRIEFTRFSVEEAAEWLGHDEVAPESGATLAELYEARRTGRRLAEKGLRTGSYL
jgi:hypothetical protein